MPVTNDDLRLRKKTRVVVAMSGGVDSSVAAILLKQQGYDVVGMALQVTDYSKYHKEASQGTCCSAKDMEDARRVAESIGMPFYVVNTEKTFDKNVVSYFVDEYKEGKTPNPCVMCNTRVKFNHLYRKALDLGADFVATGHFAKVTFDKDYGYCLWRGRDGQKDQSYFLFNLTQEQLKRTLFPIGHLTKSEVREIARKHDLPVAEKAESQEICFVPNNNYAKFIDEYTKGSLNNFGKIVTTQGVLLGRHQGIHRFTIGQRKKIGEALNQAQKLKIPNADQLRVVEINSQSKTVVLGTLKDLEQEALSLKNVNWIIDPEKFHDQEFEVKIRYRSKSARARIRVSQEDGRASVAFYEKQRAVTPGQACVLFREELCVGGGWIEASTKT